MTSPPADPTPAAEDDPLHDERQERARWFAERPARPDADYHEPTPYDWPFDAKTYRHRGGIPEPVDPWAEDA